MKPAFISEFQLTTVSVIVLTKTYLARFDVTFFFTAVRTSGLLSRVCLLLVYCFSWPRKRHVLQNSNIYCKIITYQSTALTAHS